VAPIAVDETKVVDAAYANRPELQSLVEQQVALEEEIKRLKRDYLPSINGGGSYTWTGTDYPLQENWNIGASLNLSLFSGGLTTAQVGEAEANLAALQYDAESLRQNVALEVRRAVLDLRRAAASIGVAEKGVQEARESLELAQGRYRTGVGNIIELTDAQTALTSAEASHVQALYGYRTALAALERAVGRPLTAADA
jgi:outer membrane protein